MSTRSSTKPRAGSVVVPSGKAGKRGAPTKEGKPGKMDVKEKASKQEEHGGKSGGATTGGGGGGGGGGVAEEAAGEAVVVMGGGGGGSADGQAVKRHKAHAPAVGTVLMGRANRQEKQLLAPSAPWETSPRSI